MKTANRKQYIVPNTEAFVLQVERLLTNASPGIGGDYNDGWEIEAKRAYFDDFADEEEFANEEEINSFSDFAGRICSLWE